MSTTLPGGNATAIEPVVTSCFVAPHGDELIRGELHGPEQLEALARQLAAASTVAPRGTRGQPLLRRVFDNSRFLRRAHRQIREMSRQQKVLTPDAEWLLDNYHIIYEAQREVRQDLPRGYYAQLPKLATGILAGYPRVYALALALVAHTDSSLDEAHIRRFVHAYQSVAPLTIGELWAVPTMLRLSLLENLRRLAQHMLVRWQDNLHALKLAGQPWHAERGLPGFRIDSPLTDCFVLQMLRSWQDAGTEGEAGATWLERHLCEAGTDIREVVRRESQRQAANQVCIGNCVTSLRLLSALDWNRFFDEVSQVEAILRQDPAGVYARQDFATRDRYRQVVERLARGAQVSEIDVAQRTVELATRATAVPAVGAGPHTADTAVAPPARQRHVGYYLLDMGQKELARQLHYVPRLRDFLIDKARSFPHSVYFGGLTLVTLLGVVLFVWLASGGGFGLAVLAGLVGLLPATAVAVGLVNYLVTLLLPPRHLPKFDLSDGIPADCTTFVVVPCLLSSVECAAELVEKLEIHYLADPDPNLYFALLTDFPDAPAEHRPDDEERLDTARRGIQALNQQYAAGTPTRFFLLHRRRQHNPVEDCWMGWERKRGKLHEFNRLIRGARDTSYLLSPEEVEHLPHARFVITLDADTQLPREASRRLVGTLMHPLNQPRFDPAVGRVVEGYGVLQPRVTINMIAAARTLFARIHAGAAGIDPYSVAVSDVYQDLFGAGTYIGKGIYDVDAFDAATGGRFPDNHILSHDLIEGNFARCGLATDIQVLDEYPARYNTWARREHRWIRGDWQILPWLLGSGAAHPAHLPTLQRWKILDNLRRSLVAPTLLLMLALGWLVFPGSAWLWTLAALIVLCLPLLLHLVESARAVVLGGTPLRTLRESGAELPATAAQVGLATAFVVDHARISVDATARTLARLFITHRRLLEWETAASTEARLGNSLSLYLRSMYHSPLFALALGAVIAWLNPAALWAALPLLLAWVAAPLVAFQVSQPRRLAEPPILRDDDLHILHRAARKTWHFFETFVGDEDHWLPPDNYQENPRGVVAHRTSPTNIGLLLLSTLAAHDLGYLSLRQLLDRLDRTFDTLDALERYRGHFFNWYDTTTLKALPPGYVSTVDSGNLLGCLVALRQGLREKLEEPFPSPVLRQGLTDTLNMVMDKIDRLMATPESTLVVALLALRKDADAIAALLRQTPVDLAEWSRWLDELDRLARGLPTGIDRLGEVLGEEPGHLGRWVRTLAGQAREFREEFHEVVPWVAVLAGRAGGESPRLEAPQPGALAPGSPASFLTPTSLAAWHAERDTLLATLSDQALINAMKSSTATHFLERCHALADRAGAVAAQMDFSLLYNADRHLFSVGYNMHLHRLDTAHYDLLASEAALTSFLAVARGDAPRRHWFQLGRPLTWADGGLALLSWGGTMFEYLMPRLLLHLLPGTLLESSIRTTVQRQIEYGGQRHVPWGISESGFYLLDAALDYQYQSFGVPGLGLKRGLGRDLVIAPYATGLAAMIDPARAADNFRRLTRENAEGPFGYYEAADYTAARLDPTQRSMVVRSYMAHHQGMLLVGLTNRLLGDPMPRRFHTEPMVRATELLLQERTPRTAPLYQPSPEEPARGASPAAPVVLPVSRRLTTPRTAQPRTHLLSNGEYTVLITNAGGGFSTCRDLAVTRWREDTTRDNWGHFCYIRDLRSGLLWSTAHQPVCRPADRYEVVFSIDRAEFRRLDAGIETYLEVTVSPEHDAELRRITLMNHNKQPHELELTSYAEVVLAPSAADLAHPAFFKLFLQTEYLPTSHAILCRRRPRTEQEKTVWGIHVLAMESAAVGPVQFETDRAAFLGRGRDPSMPAALGRGVSLGGATGPVLDPIFSLRCRVRLEAGSAISLAFTTAVAHSREEALALADAYNDFHSVVHDFELAWARSNVELQHLRLTAEEAHLFQRLGAHLVYTGPQCRPPVAVRAANQQGQEHLWRYGISGDKPILLARVRQAAELGLIRQLVAAHGYLLQDGLSFDLVLLDEQDGGYFKDVHDRLMQLIRASNAHGLVGKPGGIFVLKESQLEPEDRHLLPAAARIALEGGQGTLGQVLDQMERTAPPALPDALPRRVRPASVAGAESAKPRSDDSPGRRRLRPGHTSALAAPTLPPDLLYNNGFGGFTPDGREYVMLVRRDERTPAPWINVVANADFGFLVSESGGGYTWAGNSQMNRLTPWSNDPVSDPPGEAVYLRDEDTGEFWLVPGGASAWLCRHGQGYSLFEQSSNGLAQELLLVVPPDDPVKLLRLRVRNQGDQPRRLSATFFAEWVLGTLRDRAPVEVWCEVDLESGALLAHNPFNTDFGSHIAFAGVDRESYSFTCDRTEFLGRNGHITAPVALTRTGLSNRADTGSDPCAALHVPFEIAPGAEAEVVFLLGQTGTIEQVRELLSRYKQPGAAGRALDEARQTWDQILGVVQVRTPDDALNLLLNRWLLYQTLSCRVWGRSAFYQSSGAYGFRDQLQDVLALDVAAGHLTREQILRASRHQFVEGDVQHWWHPPSNRGVRTRISDDFLWLPFAVSHYLDVAGDDAVLDEQVPYLEAPPLLPGQDEAYGQPAVSDKTGNVYEHCTRAIDNGMRFGAHGLPLMGSGDWNDGMNRVGIEGKGETVWGAWFLLTILDRFVAIARKRGDTARVDRYRDEADRLAQAIEEHAWDGEWYRRAYFDNGKPLGSAENPECKIDSLPQTWAVISGRADRERSVRALASVDRFLIRRDDRLILLFTPPFDRSDLHPGYIRGYVPGIRENGGQYTHAATWVVRAAAGLGQGDHAALLLGLLNPVYHAATHEQALRYRVEPYVVCGDVYSEPPHTGRGGWTWYTGSAGWLYRVALEDVLGFRVHAGRLEIAPCVASGWKNYEVVYKYRSTEYHIRVDNPNGGQTVVQSCRLDGSDCDAKAIPLADDGRRHEVQVVLGRG
jgi:cyclic beta-1,2-glucan synthetase